MAALCCAAAGAVAAGAIDAGKLAGGETLMAKVVLTLDGVDLSVIVDRPIALE